MWTFKCFQYFTITNNDTTALCKYTYILMRVHLQGKFLQVNLLNQKVDIFFTLLHLVKFPPRVLSYCIIISNV